MWGLCEGGPSVELALQSLLGQPGILSGDCPACTQDYADVVLLAEMACQTHETSMVPPFPCALSPHGPHCTRLYRAKEITMDFLQHFK